MIVAGSPPFALVVIRYHLMLLVVPYDCLCRLPTVCLALATTQTYQLGFYTPTLLTQTGFTLPQANLLAIQIGVFCMVVVLTVTWHSDSTGLRAAYAMVASLVSSLGYGLMLIGDSNGEGYTACIMVGIFLSTAASITCIPLMAAQVTDKLRGDGDVAMYAACLATFGNIGGIVGPQIYGGIGGSMPERDGKPDYRYAHAVMPGVALLAAVLMAWIAMRVSWRETKSGAFAQALCKADGGWVKVDYGDYGARSTSAIAHPPNSGGSSISTGSETIKHRRISSETTPLLGTSNVVGLIGPNHQHMDDDDEVLM